MARSSWILANELSRQIKSRGKKMGAKKCLILDSHLFASIFLPSPFGLLNHLKDCLCAEAG
jgi:hypothetical protein